MTEQPPRFPQDLTDDALDSCIAECERAARMTAEDWKYMEMLKDEREDRIEEGRWRNDEDNEESNGDSDD